MRVLRPNDRKIVGEVDVNLIKTILENGQDLIDTEGHDLSLDDLYSLAGKCNRKALELRESIAMKKKGVFSCVSVAVKEAIDDEIRDEEESLKSWEYAAHAVWELIGMVKCMAECMVVRKEKSDDGEDDTIDFAYSYWGWKVTDKNGHEQTRFLWADHAIVQIWNDWALSRAEESEER